MAAPAFAKPQLSRVPRGRKECLLQPLKPLDKRPPTGRERWINIAEEETDASRERALVRPGYAGSLACDRRVVTQELRDDWGPHRRRVGIVDEEVPVVLVRWQQVKLGVAASRRPCLVKPLGKGRPKERVVLRIDHQERNPRRAAELTCRRHKLVRLAIVVRLPPEMAAAPAFEIDARTHHRRI